MCKYNFFRKGHSIQKSNGFTVKKSNLNIKSVLLTKKSSKNAQKNQNMNKMAVFNFTLIENLSHQPVENPTQ